MTKYARLITVSRIPRIVIYCSTPLVRTGQQLEINKSHRFLCHLRQQGGSGVSKHFVSAFNSSNKYNFVNMNRSEICWVSGRLQLRSFLNNSSSTVPLSASTRKTDSQTFSCVPERKLIARVKPYIHSQLFSLT